MQVVNKLRDKVYSTDGFLEPMRDTKEGVILIR